MTIKTVFENLFFKIEDLGQNGVLRSLSEVAEIALPVVNRATAAKKILMLKVTAKPAVLESDVDLLTACNITANDFAVALKLTTGYSLKESSPDDCGEYNNPYERHTTHWLSNQLNFLTKNGDNKDMPWDNPTAGNAALYSSSESISGNFSLPGGAQINIIGKNINLHYGPANAVLAKGTIAFGATQYNFTLTINEPGIYSLAPDHHVESEIEEALVRAFPFLKGLFKITLKPGDADAQPTTTF